MGRAGKRAASLADRAAHRLRTWTTAARLLRRATGRDGRRGPARRCHAAYTLLALPLDVGPFLEAWWEEQATVLTSATLSDGHSFSFFSERLGAGRARAALVPSPFDYPGPHPPRAHPRARPGAAPTPAYFARLADQIARLIDAAGGKCLLLFTSHRALDAVWKRLAASCASPAGGSTARAR